MIFGTLSFDLKDAIDIILVALLLFYIYRLMRASSSSNIFTGVLVFIIVWIFVSQFLKMRLLGSIFDRLINVGALALIVLFIVLITTAPILIKLFMPSQDNTESNDQ